MQEWRGYAGARRDQRAGDRRTEGRRDHGGRISEVLALVNPDKLEFVKKQAGTIGG